jgi:hypothetical protein
MWGRTARFTLGPEHIDVVLLGELLRREGLGWAIMWPALWTTTSMRLLSPMTFSTAALTEGSDCT